MKTKKLGKRKVVRPVSKPRNPQYDDAMKEKRNFEAAEKEVVDVLQKHGIDVLPEFKVQLRSWLFSQKSHQFPPQMNEGPGVVAGRI